MKITKAQLVQIIKEEADKFKKELKLKKELAQIEKQLNEVKAGGLKDAGETAGKKYDEKFKKKGTHLVEVEDEGAQMEELMAALKTIAKACGLSGTIELEDEFGDEEEVETDVIEPGDEGEDEEGEEGEEESDEETEEEETETETEEEGFTLAKEENQEENQEESLEEGENQEESFEESTQEEAVEAHNKEENTEEGKKDEGETLNESIERKRMMQLAGIKK